MYTMHSYAMLESLYMHTMYLYTMCTLRTVLESQHMYRLSTA